ncbi:MAG: sn-glycerol-3-phosphate ABC transporter ATP-binding protein UgpC [Actinomycetota bacterium]
MGEISFRGVGKVYRDGTRAVSDLNLDIADGEFVVLVGPSGCGKTTALRMVAGLEDVTEGEIRIADRVVNDVPAKDRDIAMVFQSYALYPHMTVFDNMAFGLKLRKVPTGDIRARVERAADLLGLSELLDKKPRALSGGQRQRVAMGRAIVREPRAFLMDEPLSNLDAKLRVQMRAEISALQRKLGVTTIYVTHDQVEAMTMGDRVAVMRKGVLQQVAPPQELYDNPENIFVAGFIGSPAMNLVRATPVAEDGLVLLRAGTIELPLRESSTLVTMLRERAGQEVVLGIRPENLEDVTLAPADHPRISGVVSLREPLGSEIVVHIEAEAPAAVTDDVRELAADVGQQEVVERRAGAQSTTLVARFSPRTKVQEGETIEIAVDPEFLHAFDPETGRSLVKGGVP